MTRFNGLLASNAAPLELARYWAINASTALGLGSIDTGGVRYALVHGCIPCLRRCNCRRLPFLPRRPALDLVPDNTGLPMQGFADAMACVSVKAPQAEHHNTSPESKKACPLPTETPARTTACALAAHLRATDPPHDLPAISVHLLDQSLHNTQLHRTPSLFNLWPPSSTGLWCLTRTLCRLLVLAPRGVWPQPQPS